MSKSAVFLALAVLFSDLPNVYANQEDDKRASCQSSLRPFSALPSLDLRAAMIMPEILGDLSAALQNGNDWYKSSKNPMFQLIFDSSGVRRVDHERLKKIEDIFKKRTGREFSESDVLNALVNSAQDRDEANVTLISSTAFVMKQKMVWLELFEAILEYNGPD